MKNCKGITMTVLVITIVILLILASAVVYTGTALLSTVRLQTVNTNMLLIQAKARTISEKAMFEDDKSLLKGEKLSDSTYLSVLKLKDTGVISESEDNYADYYVWNQDLLNELQMDIKLKPDEYYIVNYSTDEVINTEGFKTKDGNTYYRLSETKNITIEEEKIK